MSKVLNTTFRESVPNGKVHIKIYGKHGEESVRFSCCVDSKSSYPMLSAIDKLVAAKFENWSFIITD